MASSTRHEWDGREDKRVRRCGVDVDDESRSKELGRRGRGGALFALVAFRHGGTYVSERCKSGS